MGSDVSYLVAESPGCEPCHRSCEPCSYWTSRWSPSHPEKDKKSHMHSSRDMKFKLKHRTEAETRVTQHNGFF